MMEVPNEEARELYKGHRDTNTLQSGFTRDVRTIGHWGTGDLEVLINSWDTFEKAKPLMQQSYLRG